MRLWSLHPQHLDSVGLVALWREGLLAQKVLRGLTKGYRAHPQLARFRIHADPVGAIGFYLSQVVDEADRRGYRFDRSKLAVASPVPTIPLHDGQLAYEWMHLLAKLKARSPEIYKTQHSVSTPAAHPSFHLIAGSIEAWERV